MKKLVSFFFVFSLLIIFFIGCSKDNAGVLKCQEKIDTNTKLKKNLGAEKVKSLRADCVNYTGSDTDLEVEKWLLLKAMEMAGPQGEYPNPK